MAEYNKTKFYWLQLKDDFFDDEAIDWLEEQENGEKYVLFYLKLCLKSLKYGGILIRQAGTMLIPYDDKKLAEITKCDIDTVKVAMVALRQTGLVEIKENGALYLQQVSSLVNFTTKGAERRKLQRENTKGDTKGDKCHPQLTTTITNTITNTNTQTGIEKSLVDNFPTELMATYAESKRLPLKVIEDYKESYLLWIQSNPTKKECKNRDLKATVQQWVVRDIKGGKIVPKKTREEIINNRLDEIEAEYGKVLC